MNPNNNNNFNNAVSTLPYLSPLSNIHFINYLIQPPVPLPPPPSISEVASLCAPDALSQAVNSFIKAFDAQINRNRHEPLNIPLTFASFQDSISPSLGVDEFFFQIKYHIKPEIFPIFTMLQNLNNSVDQFYKFITKSSEIKNFDAAIFKILIKLAFMKQNEREFVAASYANGQFWQKFQSIAKFPSKQSETEFFAYLCKFFFLFVYQYQFQNANQSTAPPFMLSFPYDFTHASTVEYATTPKTNGNLQISDGRLQSFNEYQHGNMQSFQSNTLSSQSVALLIDALKGFNNSNSANMGNGSTSVTNFPLLSTPVLPSTQNTVTVNQVSPAPSDPIPPIQGTPPNDNNTESSTVAQTQAIFSYSTPCTGVSQPFQFGNNFDQLNHLISQNGTYGTAPTGPCLGTNATSLLNFTNEPFSSDLLRANMSDDNTDVISSVSEEPSSPVTLNNFEEDENHPRAHFGAKTVRTPNEPVHRHDNVEYEQTESSHLCEPENETFEEQIVRECITISGDEALKECNLPEQQNATQSYTSSNYEEEEEDGGNISSSSHQIEEKIEEKSAPLFPKIMEDEEFIEIDDYEPKVECHVPIEVAAAAEVPKIAPLKINLKLLQAFPSEAKSLKRKSNHKSRKSYKEADDNDNDNEYKSRIKIEDFDSSDTCYTDPLALRKIQRKTSAQIKQEQENFIEFIYKQPDDEKKLKVIYPNVQAEIVYNPGDYITKFIGDIITSRTVYNENKDNPFLIEIGRNKWIDGKDQRSFGVYILPADVLQKANTTIKLHTTKNNIVFVGFYATQRIYPGEYLYFKR